MELRNANVLRDFDVTLLDCPLQEVRDQAVFERFVERPHHGAAPPVAAAAAAAASLLPPTTAPQMWNMMPQHLVLTSRQAGLLSTGSHGRASHAGHSSKRQNNKQK